MENARNYPLLVGVVLALMASPTTTSADIVSDESACGPVKESVSLFFDYSGSMLMKRDSENQEVSEQQTPLETAKLVGRKIMQSVPAGKFRWGIYTAAPYTVISDHGVLSNTETAEKLKNLSTNFGVMGRRSPLGIAVESHARFLKDKARRSAVILFTDGKVNRGRNFAESVRTFYRLAPQSCLHIISFSGTPKEAEGIAQLGGASSCAVIESAGNLLKNERALKRFVEQALYKECRKAFSLRGINFGFDRYDIDSSSEQILQTALVHLQDLRNNETVEIHGWTDHTGSRAYNLRLSQQRADSVRNWLINQGYDPQRIVALGHGKSFLYSNHTKEGRYKNRRIDFRIVTLPTENHHQE